jgi:hypothetical protein
MLKAGGRKTVFPALGAEHVLEGQRTYGTELYAEAIWWNTMPMIEVIHLSLSGSKHKPIVKQLEQIAKTVIPPLL